MIAGSINVVLNGKNLATLEFDNYVQVFLDPGTYSMTLNHRDVFDFSNQYELNVTGSRHLVEVFIEPLATKYRTASHLPNDFNTRFRFPLYLQKPYRRIMPMFGGVDRQADPDLKTADEQFVEEQSVLFGSRQEAAEIFVEQAFQSYEQSNFIQAMDQLNQAWLLDPQNAKAYWGFSTLLYRRDDYCGAMRMADIALKLNYDDPKFLAETAIIFSLCALSDESLSRTRKHEHFVKSDELFAQAAELAPTRHYIYQCWWQALYWRGEYRHAWQKVDLLRRYGGEPHPRSLNRLIEKMSKPD